MNRAGTGPRGDRPSGDRLSGDRPTGDGTTGERAVRVVIVDDDALVRAGLRMILGGAPDVEIVGEASDGIQGVSLVQLTKPDVVLMDIRMPGRDGIEATRLLLAPDVQGTREHAVRIIVLTTFDTDDLVTQALRAGASGFLLKDTEPARLVEAVRLVAAGEPILSPSVTATLISKVTTHPRARSERHTAAVSRLSALTEREHEVALAIGRGLSNAEISRQLFLSVPTVKAHVSRILDKLGADNRVQVAITIHEAGLT